MEASHLQSRETAKKKHCDIPNGPLQIMTLIYRTGIQPGERAREIQPGEQAREIQPGEQAREIQPGERAREIQPGEQAREIQPGERAREIQPGEQAREIQPGEQAREIQPGEQAREIQPGERAREIQPGEQAREIQPGERAREIQPGERAREIQPGERAREIQPGEQAREIQPGERAREIQPGEQAREIQPGERMGDPAQAQVSVAKEIVTTTPLDSFDMRCINRVSLLTTSWSRTCSGDSETVEICSRKTGSLQRESDRLHHCHEAESVDSSVNGRITSSAEGELSDAVTAKHNPRYKPPGCPCGSSDCNPTLSQDSGYLSQDSGSSSLLSQSSLLVEEEENLVQGGDRRARSSSESRACGGEQSWDWTSGKEPEDPTAIPHVHSAAVNPSLEVAPVNLPDKNCVPVEWGNLPALKAGWAACHIVDHDEGKLKETSQEQNFNVINLIGRKMGLEHVDIWKELSQRGFPHLLKKIMRFLPLTVLLKCVKVSKTWRNIVFGDKTRSQFLKEASRSQKWSAADIQGDGPIRRYTVSRGALSSVQRVGVKSPLKSLIQTDSLAKLNPNSHNWIRNQRLVRILKWDETIKTCPLCTSPAKFLPCEERAICSSEHCSYDYCSLCFNAFHGSKDCTRRHFRKRSQLQPQAGSKKSKQNLKRL
ncbi:F-box only protein 5-like [Carcharodon carcharias]|uniref:F-box only protein 5-like n=1 Tax=Carcharodon carcharias TaxID=13397 RepID=UPI001B7EDD35|nr:F-box only protein 5-like [Carcharodon carcharias]